MMLEYFRMALSSLKKRRLRSWLTMIGIIIGITSVVALIGLGQGLQAAIANIFGGLGTDKLTISADGGFGPPGTGVVNPLTKKNVEDFRDINGVDSAVGRLIKAGTLEFNKKVGFGYAASMPLDDPEGMRLIASTLDLKAKEGRLLSRGDNKKVVVGSQLGELEEFFGKDIVPGEKILIQGEEFEVIGVLEKLGNPLFDSMVLMDEEDVRVIFKLSDDQYDMIAVQVRDEHRIDSIKADIERYLRKDRDVDAGEEDFSVTTPSDAAESVSSTLGAVNMFVYVIAAISILVGGIGIMNTMFMSVTERTRDIGIMKSIGATNNTIFMLFFIESGVLGMVGGIIGALIGSFIAMLGAMGLQSFLGGDIEIGASLGPVLLIGAVGGSFLIGSLFGTLPAVRASRLNPVDALRHRK